MKFERDKALHFAAGFLIAVVVGFVTSHGFELMHAAFIGFAVATVIGWGKEYIYDKARPEAHTVDKRDFEVTAAGGFWGGIAYIVMAQVV